MPELTRSAPRKRGPEWSARTSVLILLLTALLTPTFFAMQASAHESGTSTLQYSRSADRAAPLPLGGALLTGLAYVHLPSDPQIVQVDFFLDDPGMTGSPRHTERTAPFDFQGGSLASASAFDTRTIADGSHTVTSRLTYTDGDTAVGDTSFQVSNPPVSSTTQLNAGGSKTTVGGVTWLADTYFVGGKATSNSNIADILGTMTDTIFTTQRTASTRLGGFSYAIPAPTSGTYTVTLNFAEIYFGATGGASGGAGKRVFSVNLEGGTPELVNFDIYKSVGAMTATSRNFTIAVTDGTLNLDFTATVDRPAVASIAVVSPGVAPPPATAVDPAAFSWQTKAPSPIARSEAQGTAVGSKIYVFGGFYSGTTVTARSNVFDTASNTWTALPDLPMLLSHSAAVADGTTIWLVGGYVGSDPGGATTQVWKFDTLTSTLSAGPPLPQPRGAGAAAIVGRELHFFGGTNRVAGAVNDPDQGDHWAFPLDDGAQWSERAPIPNPRNHLAAVALDGHVYAIGGQHIRDEVAGLVPDVDRYDPATDSWTSMPALPKARSHLVAVVRDGQILAIGGTNPGATSSRDVTAFDPTSGAWSNLPQLSGGRKAPVVGLVGDVVWVTGGSLSTSTYSGRFADRWEYGPAMPVALGEVAGGVIGRNLYLVGEGNSATLALDLGTGTWRSNLPVRPFPGSHHAAEVIDGELYLFGGIGSSAGVVQIYSPLTNAWRLGPPMPFAAGSSASAVIDGQVYVAGGIVGQATTSRAAGFDPVSQTWTEVAPMPVGRNHAASASDGERLWVIGGRGAGSGDNNSVANGFDTVQVYDPETDVWRSSDQPDSGLTPLPQARGGMGKAAFIEGELYVMGGETVSGLGATAAKVYSRVDILDPLSGTWRQGAPMLTARHGIYPLAIGNRITVAGGGVKSGSSSSSLTQTYTVAHAT